MQLQLKRLPQPQDRLIMTRRTFLTALDHSGLGIMNVIPYAIHPGATLMMEIVKVAFKIHYSLLFREFQTVAY